MVFFSSLEGMLSVYLQKFSQILIRYATTVDKRFAPSYSGTADRLTEYLVSRTSIVSYRTHLKQ